MAESKDEDEPFVIVERIICEMETDDRKAYIVKLESNCTEWRRVFKDDITAQEDTALLIENFDLEQKFIRKINLEYFSDHPRRRVFGFSRGMAPVEIVKIIMLRNLMLCEIRWESGVSDLASYYEARLKCPQLVIRYLQKFVNVCKPSLRSA
jgi:hypothetical protein